MRRIYVLQRGWVVCGIETQARTDREVVIEDVVCIRRWGTSWGLGELAASGPTDETRLDPLGTVRVHPLAIVMEIDCEEAEWPVGRVGRGEEV